MCLAFHGSAVRARWMKQPRWAHYNLPRDEVAETAMGFERPLPQERSPRSWGEERSLDISCLQNSSHWSQMGCAISCFSRLRSEGFSFYFGGLGLGRVRSTPLATVQNHPQPFATSSLWPCLWRVLQKWYLVTFGCFKLRAASFRAAGVALNVTSQHVSIHNASSRSVWQARSLASFSEDDLRCSWQAQQLKRLHRHFVWLAQHFRCVVLRVFSESHWQGCVKWQVLTTCKFRGRRGIL